MFNFEQQKCSKSLIDTFQPVVDASVQVVVFGGSGAVVAGWNTQGSKHKTKHTPDVEILTPDHKDALNVHAVSLVGANGKQEHAVAVVNGMIFDDFTTNATLLCCKALDWCCNCEGGCAKTGKTMHVTTKNASLRLQS